MNFVFQRTWPTLSGPTHLGFLKPLIELGKQVENQRKKRNLGKKASTFDQSEREGKMWLAGLVKNTIKGGNGGGGGGGSLLVRYMSKSRAVNVRKINPKVPIEEAKSIAGSLYELIKQRGPLTIPSTWSAAQEAGIGGLSSKTHMKIMLKWMRGRKLLKLFCNQVGSNKKFLHCTLPEEPRTDQLESPLEPELQTKKPSAKRKKKTMKKSKK